MPNKLKQLISKTIRKNRLLYKLAAKTHMALRPPFRLQFEINIEETTYCNLHCSFCTHEELISNKMRPLKTMSDETFKQTLDFIEKIPKPAKRRFSINVTGLGEPFTYPKFVERLQIIRQRIPQAYLCFATNATLFNEEIAQKIVPPKMVDLIICSLRFPDKQRYCEDTGNDYYDLVVSNIKRLFAIRQGDKPSIHVQIFAPEDFIKAQKTWQPYFQGEDKLYVIPRQNMVGFLHRTNPQKLKACLAPLRGLTINVDGEVFPCCESLWIPRVEGLFLGHVSDSVRVHENHERLKLERYRLEPCKFCTSR